MSIYKNHAHFYILETRNEKTIQFINNIKYEIFRKKVSNIGVTLTYRKLKNTEKRN